MEESGREVPKHRVVHRHTFDSLRVHIYHRIYPLSPILDSDTYLMRCWEDLLQYM